MRRLSLLPALPLLIGAWLLAGCAASADPEPSDAQGSTSSVTEDIEGGHAFSLPWQPGRAYWVGQGEHGVVPGQSTPGDHAISSMVHAIDFGLPLDTPVLAARGGTVVKARGDVKPGDPCYDGGGKECADQENYVLVRHADGTDTLYMHFSRVWVHPGQGVKRGTELGRSGSTGWSSGPHLHVQRQRDCGKWFCDSIPLPYDDLGIPGAGSLPIASYDGKERCWSDALDRFVGNSTCVQNPASQSWHECQGGQWQGVSTCSSNAHVYGFCQNDDGSWKPERSCGVVDGAWKQCGDYGQWEDGVGTLVGGNTLGGPIGACASP